MNIVDNVVTFLSECTDEVLALVVVCGTMASYFMGVEVPIELAGGILAYYFIRHQD